MRYGVDLWLLLGSAVVFYLTTRNGYQLVLVPEGLPALSVNYWAFAGPAMFWAGAALLSWRLADLLLSRGRGVMARLSRPLAGSLSGTVAASMSRQRRVITRTVTLLALAIVFAASTAIFDATYRQQARVDALLTNGADVTVTESPGALAPPALAQAIAKVPGVGSVEPLQHRFAYVGSDLQDLYGVRPATVTDATRLQDAYFSGGTARQLMSILARQPDAILVSEETVRDFQLNPVTCCGCGSRTGAPASSSRCRSTTPASPGSSLPLPGTASSWPTPAMSRRGPAIPPSGSSSSTPTAPPRRWSRPGCAWPWARPPASPTS